ncbi:hypothetical protein CRYUN_Cryun25bG0040800 [Craigia yunnanensis]
MLSKYRSNLMLILKDGGCLLISLKNSAFELEMLTPVFPHLFVLIAAAAGAGKSEAALIQAAIGSYFYAGFAAQRNFAEVTVKVEA